jgi:hypothetical protein
LLLAVVPTTVVQAVRLMLEEEQMKPGVGSRMERASVMLEEPRRAAPLKTAG